MKEINAQVIEQFRAGGEVQGMHRDRLLLLTTTGAKSGLRRTTPMMFHREPGRILVIASNSGAPHDPDWYRNLVQDPQVTVEVGDESYEATASPLTGDDREATWAKIKELYPFFAQHEAQTERPIPLVALVAV
ncbi:MAG: nitroreductase/quinone reductase family protein [Propionibacteriaceae bacterium]